MDATPRSRGMKITIAMGVAAGLAVGVTALAGAVTAPDPVAPVTTPDHRHGPGPGPDRRDKAMAGPGIHGEFVVPAPGGGYQTMASQHGEVTDVSPTSITVKSEDGYTKTYAVDDGTVVEAGDNGIGDVKVGDQVGVLGVVGGDTTKAVEVRDRTAVGDRHDRWAPKGPADPANPVGPAHPGRRVRPGGPGGPGGPGVPGDPAQPDDPAEPPASPPTTVS
jgi:hypothetical protein